MSVDTSSPAVQQWIGAMAAARVAGQPLPVGDAPSTSFPLADGYAYQAAYVKAWSTLVDSPIGGFKGAATNAGAQKAMGLDGPLAGVLLAGSQLEQGATVSLADMAGCSLETEIAYRIGQRVDAPLPEDASPLSVIDAVAGAIEFPDPAVNDPKAMSGPMVAATDAFASRHLIGPPSAAASFDGNAETVVFKRGDELLHEASGSEAMGDQLASLRLIIDTVASSGYVLEPGHWIITGALGLVAPGKPGHYVATYSTLGDVTFSVTA